MKEKEFVDYYKLLEISSNATEEEIKHAFWRMSKKYHPDKVATLGEELQAEYTKKFQQLQEARSVLSDRLKKMRYDFKYRQHERKLKFTNIYEDDGIEYEETDSEDLSEPWKESLKSRSSKEKASEKTGPAGQFTYIDEEKLYAISARRYEPRPKKKSSINIKSGIVKVTDTFGTLLKGNQLFKKGKYSRGYSLKDKVIVGTLVVAIAGSAVAMHFSNDDSEDVITTVSSSTDYATENNDNFEALNSTEVTEETTAATEEVDDSVVLYRIHKVVTGDILSVYSKDSNTTIEELKRVNNTKSEVVQLGKDYIIPYIIEPEDLKFYTQTAIYNPSMTIEDFAKEYETNIVTLETLNPEAIDYDGSQYAIATDTLVVPNFITKEDYEVLKAAERIKEKTNIKE